MAGTAVVFGWAAVLVLALLSAAFWSDPSRGLRQTSHRIEKLPQVMADRYAAFAVLGAAIASAGHLPLLAVFFGVCAWMGFADGVIYRRAGHAHWKHTASGVAASVALLVTLLAILAADRDGIGAVARASSAPLPAGNATDP